MVEAKDTQQALSPAPMAPSHFFNEDTQAPPEHFPEQMKEPQAVPEVRVQCMLRSAVLGDSARKGVQLPTVQWPHTVFILLNFCLFTSIHIPGSQDGICERAS